jgi:cell division septation protein DedD
LRFLRVTLGAVCASAILSACSGSGSSVAPVIDPRTGAAVGARPALHALRADAVVRSAATGSNVVVNGTFETGDLSGWTADGTGTGAARISTVAHTGSYSMYAGTGASPEVDGYYGLEQSVTIPAGGTLSLYARGISSDTSTYADEEADLINASGTIVKSCFNALLHTTTWTLESCDVSSLAGQTLTLFVGVYGSGGGYYVEGYFDDITLVGSGATPTPTASPTATASAKPSASPTASAKPSSSPTATATATPTASAKPTVTPTPTGTPKPTATPTVVAYPIDTNAFTVVPESNFESIIQKGHNIRFSTYYLASGSLLNSLVSAAQGGASVTVDLPSDSYVMSTDVYTTDEASAKQITSAGGTVVWDAGTQSPNNEPLHAKLAIVDGTAYLDGRNWDSSDVILSETGSADLTAIGNALALNPTDSATLDTIKQDALSLETTFIQDASGSSVDYMTESFGAGNVANALIARAQAGGKVTVIVLKSDTSATSDKTLDQLVAAGADVELNPGSGSEKMAIIGSQAWFGSSNSTAGSPYQIDWGAVFNGSAVLSTLQSNFNSVLSTCTKYTSSS